MTKLKLMGKLTGDHFMKKQNKEILRQTQKDIGRDLLVSAFLNIDE
jgi:hypothetical protein